MKRKNAVKRNYLLKWLTLHLYSFIEIAHSNVTQMTWKLKKNNIFSTNLSGIMGPTKTETFLLVVPVNVTLSSAEVQRNLFWISPMFSSGRPYTILRLSYCEWPEKSVLVWREVRLWTAGCRCAVVWPLDCKSDIWRKKSSWQVWASMILHYSGSNSCEVHIHVFGML